MTSKISELGKQQLIDEFINIQNNNANVKPINEFINGKTDIMGNIGVNVRISTFNIHLWCDANNHLNITNILNTIEKIDADIMVLEEILFNINTIKYDKFVDRINGMGYKYHAICHKYGSNVIISKYPFTHKILFLQKDPIKHQNRYAIFADVTLLNNVKLHIIGTHLDVFDETETTRLTQIQQILQNITDKSKLPNTIILGDLNTVSRDDYTEGVWNDIVLGDLNRGVQTVSRVIPYLYDNDFVDVFKLLKKVVPITVWSLRRVDYILLHKQFKYTVKDAYDYPTHDSDHTPLILILNL